MPTESILDGLYSPIEEELGEVRAQVSGLWNEALMLVHGPSLAPVQTGGKLLRPALCLLSAGALGARDIRRFVPLATSMELLHLGALTHDDVVDGATMRRGMRSLNARWDDRAAILAGDYLVARAVELLGTLGSTGVIMLSINSVREMAEAELKFFGLGPGDMTEDDCVELARKKTASLFAASCGGPACLIEKAPHDDLHAYGLAMGIAFQIIDDLLDLVQDPKTLGKPACADIVEGKQTLPILYMRESLDSDGIGRLDAMKGRPADDSDRQWVLTVLEESGARAKTESVARHHADMARKALADIAQSDMRECMVGLVDFVLNRTS